METLTSLQFTPCGNLYCKRKTFSAIKKAFAFFALIFVNLLCINSARAATYYWTGTGGNSDWTNTGNWYLYPLLGLFSGYPQSGDIAYIGSNSPILNTNYFTGPYNPTVNATSICSQLYIGEDKASTLTVSNPLTVSNTFRLYSSGTVNATAAITVSNSSSSILNAGAFSTTSGNILLSGNGSSFQNSTTGVVNISGATVTMATNAYITNAASGSFTIKGTSVVNFGTTSYITNSGTFYAGITNSSCTLNLSQANNTITNNSGALFYLGSTSVLNLNGNTAKVNNSGGFTLQSDASGSAAIGNISGTGAALTGYYNVERFFTGGGLTANRGYRLLSSPVNQTGATASTSTFGISYLKNHTYLSVAYGGAFVAGISGTGGGFNGPSIGPTLYLYKEPLAASNTSYTSGKHVGIVAITVSGSPTSTSTGTTATVNTSHATDLTVSNLAIPIGNGFIFFFVGPSTRSTGSATGGPPADATVTANGYMNQGNFVVHLWFNGSGVNTLSYAAALNPGYCMVGNPYPSTINLATVASDNGGIDNIYVLNSRAGGTNQNYIAYSATGGSSSPLTQQYAVSGGGFIVHATSGTATLTFKESQKASTINPTGTGLIMSAPKAGILAVDGKLGNNTLSAAQQRTMAMQGQAGTALSGLYLKMEKDSLNYDYCGVYFGSNYNAKFEDGDAIYLSGPNNVVTMASLSADGVKAAVNNLPDYHNGAGVKLNVNASATGLYKLKMEGVRNIDTLYDIYLIDRYMNDSLDIRRYGVYNFNLNKADTATFGPGRFSLSIRRKPLPQYLLTNFYGSKAQSGLLVTWKTQNEYNYTGFTLEKQTASTGEYTALYDKQSDGSATYNFLDATPNSGSNTYRLKQNDADGRVSYSQPITIFFDKLAGNGLINVFPNPTAEIINVSIPGTTTGQSTYRMMVYNSSGYAVMQKTTSNNTWSENIATFRPGVYVVEVAKADGTLLGKVKFIKN